MNPHIHFSEQTKNKILKARALKFARENTRPHGTKDYETTCIIGFRLAYENYGIDASFVREVISLKAFTPLPGLPPFIIGITNIRGQIRSIVDLKILFGLPQKGLPDNNKLIIIHNSKMEFGILADEITGTSDEILEDIHPTISTLSPVQASYVQGITSNRTIILNVNKILSDPQLLIR